MGVGRAIESVNAGQARVVAVFIYVGGIQRIGTLMIVLHKPPGQHHARLRGLFAIIDSGRGIIIQLLVDDHHITGCVQALSP